MSKIITDSLGADIELFTTEEITAQKEAAIKEYQEANPGQIEDLVKLQEQLKASEEELTKLKNKDLNFANLRNQKDTAEAKIEALRKDIDEKIGIAKKEVLEGVMKDHYSETLNNLSGNDAELKKKIEYEYNRLKDAAGTKDEVAKKLRDAWYQATKPEDLGALNSSVISSGGVSRMGIKSDKKFTQEEKVFAQKLADAGGLGQLEDKNFN